MNIKQISVILFFLLVFNAVSRGQPVFAERENPELEFLIENARKEINKQEVAVYSLRKRFEDILKRKRALQQFIDQENKKIEEFKLKKSKSLVVRPLKAEPVSLKRINLPVSQKAVKESPVLRKEKERQKREQEIAKRNAVQDNILRQQEKNAPAVIKSGAEKKQSNIKEESLKCQPAKQETQLREKENKIKLLLAQESAKKGPEAKKQQQVKLLIDQKAQDQKAKEQKAQEEIIKKQQQAALAKKQKKEQELLSKKLEKERLLAEEKEQRMIREKECQMRLLLEADKNAKHERYVSQLGQLLNRQNYLLEESRKLESQIHQEEETLMGMERTRQELIRKLLENP